MKTTFIITAAQSGARRLPMSLVLAAAMMFAQNATAATAVDLLTATDFAVLAGSGITNTNTTTITGDVGSFPITTQTGFGSVVLNGTNHYGDAVTQSAKNSLSIAYTDAANRTPTMVFAPIYDLGGQTLVPGVYRDPSSFAVTGTLTLNAGGNPNAVWIFQSGSTLTTAGSSTITLIGGAQACNVFWQVGSSATLGTYSNFSGTILALTDITLTTGATLNGRALALNGTVTMDGNTVSAPICLTLTPAEVAALAALSAPEELTAIYAISYGLMDSQVFALEQHFADMRAGQPPQAQAPIEEPVWDGKRTRNIHDKSVHDVYSKGTRNVRSGRQTPQGDGDSEDYRYGFFITATGSSTIQGGSPGANGYDIKSGGTMLGVDVRLNDRLTVGVSVGYARSSTDLINGGKITVDGGRVAAYAMYYDGAFFVQGLLGGGYNSYDTERAGLGGTAKGSTDGSELDAAITFGYDIKMKSFTLTPFASLLYTLVHINGYDETGSQLPLHIESQSEASLRSRIGLRAAYTMLVHDTTVTPSFSAQWQHQFLNHNPSILSRALDGSTGEFSANGPQTSRDSALLTAALNVAWSRYAAYLAYQADLGRNYQSQSILAGFRVSW